MKYLISVTIFGALHCLVNAALLEEGFVYTRNIDWSGVTGKRKFYIDGRAYRGLEWKREDPKR